MPKTAVDQWDTTAANNTDIGGVGIVGNVNTISNLDNAIRELMAQIATWRTAANFSLVSTDAGAAAAPDLKLYRNSASPAASDIIGRVLFQGEDSAGNTEDYAEVYGTISDPTSTSEDATVLVRVKSAGSMTTSGTFTGTGFQGAVGATTPSTGAFTTITGAGVTLTSTDAGASAGPTVTLYRNSASPAASDNLATVAFDGEDENGTQVNYAAITGVIATPSGGSASGQLDVYALTNGSSAKVATFGSFTLAPGTNDGQALGSATRSWADLFLASGAVQNYANGNYTVTHSSGLLTFSGGIAVTGGQVAFPASQNASANANTLDDYEEGTTTPTVTAGAGTFTTVSCALSYTKIGDRVLWDAVVTITTAGTAVGAINIPLPFTVGVAGAVAGYELSTGRACGGRLDAAGTTAAVVQYDGTTIIASGRTVRVMGHYRV